ncbi:hypothetical protein BURKHO8Y_580065 [Burkholderia sp. 8Y]|nr:hypothetical protein BURKHO8Y_580065 [Burkholderia sp. 8Y]
MRPPVLHDTTIVVLPLGAALRSPAILSSSGAIGDVEAPRMISVNKSRILGGKGTAGHPLFAKPLAWPTLPRSP